MKSVRLETVSRFFFEKMMDGIRAFFSPGSGGIFQIKTNHFRANPGGVTQSLWVSPLRGSEILLIIVSEKCRPCRGCYKP